MHRLLVLVTLATGCFVQVGASYAPSATVGLQRAADPSPITHKEGAFTFNFRLGVDLDLAGFGVYYAPYSPRVTRSVSGFPRNLHFRGSYLRLDADIPVRFGPNKMFGLRASYVHETFDKAGGYGENFDAEGSGNAGGLTVSTLSKDISLNVLVGKYSFSTVRDPLMTFEDYPEFSMEAVNIDVGVTIRFIPTGTLISHYVYDSSSPIITSSSCGYRLAKFGGGYVCE